MTASTVRSPCGTGGNGKDDIALVMRVLAEVQRRGFAPFKPEHQLELHRLTHFEPELAARSWLLVEEVREILVTGLEGPDADRSALFRARVLASACIVVVDAASPPGSKAGWERI